MHAIGIGFLLTIKFPLLRQFARISTTLAMGHDYKEINSIYVWKERWNHNDKMKRKPTIVNRIINQSQYNGIPRSKMDLEIKICF